MVILRLIFFSNSILNVTKVVGFLVGWLHPRSDIYSFTVLLFNKIFYILQNNIHKTSRKKWWFRDFLKLFFVSITVSSQIVSKIWFRIKLNIQIKLFSTSIRYHKVHIFWEGHKILRNLHLTFVLCSASQK